MTRDNRLDEVNSLLEDLTQVESGEEEVERDQELKTQRQASYNFNGFSDPVLNREIQRNRVYLADVQNRRGRVANYVDARMAEPNDLVSALDKENLAKNAYKIIPSEIKGNKGHNERAQLHIAALNAAQTIQKGADAKDVELLQLATLALEEEAKADFEKRYSSKDEWKNQYNDPKAVERLGAVVPALRVEDMKERLLRNRSLLYEKAKAGAEVLKSHFEDSFNNETERAEYTAANLRASYAKGGKPEDKAGFAKAIYTVDKTR